MGCRKECCRKAWNPAHPKLHVVSLAVVDWKLNKWWLVEASPDIALQIQMLHEQTNGQLPYMPDGILITHAHIGHYTGLMQLGREVMHTNAIPVYVMPKMAQFLVQNGPWSQLVQLNNISIRSLNQDKDFRLSDDIVVSPVQVPHRDEFSETVGFKIGCAGRNYLFIPDIDKWQKWNLDIVTQVNKCDVAFLDATFYHEGELSNRSIEEIPHPLVTETIKLFEKEEANEKKKINFIHLNHTNPLLWSEEMQKHIQTLGFQIAVQGNWY